MRHYRCKCGKSEWWGSMPPHPCSGCPKCGTSLDGHPDDHGTPKPHEFVAHDVETDAGPATISRCRWCTYTKAQIAMAKRDEECDA